MASDAALADTADARSTTGWWISLCAGAAWSWAVEKLRLVVLSSTEAEYCGAANARKEVLAQKQLFKEFQPAFPEQSIPFYWTISQQLRWHVVRRRIIKERSILQPSITTSTSYCCRDVRFQHQATSTNS
jgi:hypothetical protein